MPRHRQCTSNHASRLHIRLSLPRFSVRAAAASHPRCAGDAATAALGLYLIWEARNLGMPKSAIVRMAGNIGVDALLGAIPIIGVIPDLFFRSNSRNLKLIKAHLDRHHPSTVIIDQ